MFDFCPVFLSITPLLFKKHNKKMELNRFDHFQLVAYNLYSRCESSILFKSTHLERFAKTWLSPTNMAVPMNFQAWAKIFWEPPHRPQYILRHSKYTPYPRPPSSPGITSFQRTGCRGRGLRCSYVAFTLQFSWFVFHARQINSWI